MSGGIAFVYDVENNFEVLCNKEMVELEAPDKEDEVLLKELIQKHFDKTGSAVAKFILADFDHQLNQFVKVFPSDYKKALAKQKSKLVVTK
jgi:glutamate synthase (NADPH/NADH) large chain